MGKVLGRIAVARAVQLLSAFLTAALLFAGADAAAQAGGARVVPQANYGLKAGGRLKAGEYLVSRDAKFFAIMQADGNFAIYRGTGPRDKKEMIFETRTGGQPAGAYFAAMQADGNFVVYRSNGQPLFDTKTYGLGNGNYFAQLNTDGSFVVEKNADAAGPAGVLWSSRTGANPAFATAGGKLVAASPAMKAAAAKAAADAALAKASAEASAAKAAADAAVAKANAAAAAAKAAVDHAAALAAAPFQSGGNILKTGKYLTVGQYMVSAKKGYYAILNSDGNFCHNKGSGPRDHHGEIWCSGTNGPQGPYHVVMQSDGNFCLRKGHDPKNTIPGYMWCTAGVAAPTGEFYALIQDDSNFVIYQGRGPHANTKTVSLWNRISAAEASRNGWDRFKDSVSGAYHYVAAGITDVANAVASGTVDAAEITANAAKSTANAAKSSADAAVAHAKAAADAAAAAAKAAADSANAAAKASADAAAAAAAATAKASTDAANAAAKTAADAANATKHAANVTVSAADKAASDAAAATVGTAKTVARGTVGLANTVTGEIVSTSNLVANTTTSVAVTVGRGVQQGGVIVGNEIVKDGKVVGYAIADVAKEAWALLTGNCGVIGRTVFPLPVNAYFAGANQIAGSLSKFGTVDPKTGKAIQNVQASANQCYEKIQDGFYCSFPAELSKLASSAGSMPGNMINLATRVFNQAKTKECLIAGAATISLAGAGAGMCGLGEVVVSDAQKAFACFSAAQSKGIIKKFLPSGAAAAQSFPSDEACRGMGELAFQVAEKVVTDGISTEAKAAVKAGKGRTVAVVADELRSVYKIAGAGSTYNNLMDELTSMPECKD